MSARDPVCLTEAGVQQARDIASNLSEGAGLATLIARSIPAGYPDLEGALDLLSRDLDRQAHALAELVHV